MDSALNVGEKMAATAISVTQGPFEFQPWVTDFPAQKL